MDRARRTGPWALLPTHADWRAAHAHPRRDLVAGLTVAVVALPLALAFGVSSGLGAQAGLVTAVVAGALAAVFGGSNLQVSGPTGAMTVVLIPVVHRFGAHGVLTVGLLAGAILVVLASARVGGLVRLLPMPVIEGFTAGIAVVIALQQVPAALGVDGGQHEHVWAAAATAVAGFVSAPTWPAVALAVGVAALMLLGPRLLPALPFSLVGVVLATLVVAVAGLDVTLIGALPTELPAPSLALTHAVVLAVIVLGLSGIVGRIPLAALAGVLLATTVRMVEVGSLRALLRSTRREAAVLVVTFAVTVAIDLVTAVIVGLAVAVLLALHRVAGTAGGEQVPVGPAPDGADHTDEERALFAEHIVAYRFDGPLFFATAHRLLLETSEIADVRVVVLRMSRVSSIDATGAQVLDDAIRRLERRGTLVLLSGLRPECDRALEALGVVGRLRRQGAVFPDSVSAIEYARAYLASDAALPAGLTPA